MYAAERDRVRLPRPAPDRARARRPRPARVRRAGRFAAVRRREVYGESLRVYDLRAGPATRSQAPRPPVHGDPLRRHRVRRRARPRALGGRARRSSTPTASSYDARGADPRFLGLKGKVLADPRRRRPLAPKGSTRRARSAPNGTLLTQGAIADRVRGRTADGASAERTGGRSSSETALDECMSLVDGCSGIQTLDVRRRPLRRRRCAIDATARRAAERAHDPRPRDAALAAAVPDPVHVRPDRGGPRGLPRLRRTAPCASCPRASCSTRARELAALRAARRQPSGATGTRTLRRCVGGALGYRLRYGVWVSTGSSFSADSAARITLRSTFESART